MSKPTVIITAAGENSRFFPFNTDTHKGCLTLMGQKLIARTLRNLADHDFHTVVIVVSEKDFNGQGLSGEILPSDFPELEIRYVLQPEAKGMGNALLLAEPELVGEQFCAIFPYFYQAGEVLEQMLRLGTQEVVCASTPENQPNYGLLLVENGRATGLIEKPSQTQLASSQHQIKGVYVLSRRILHKLKTVSDSHYNFEEVLHELMQHEPLPVFHLAHDLPSLKYPWHLFNHQTLFFQSLTSYRADSARIDPTAVIDETHGPVYVGENVTIGHAAKVVGPCYLGADSLVGDFSFVRHSSLEAKAQVGANTEVVRSIIMSGASTHFSYLADSIIGQGVKIGAGLITGNKRLDRENVRTLIKQEMKDTGRPALGVMIGHRANLGIRVSTMPGVSIGSRATIFPGQVLFKNVPHQAEVR